MHTIYDHKSNTIKAIIICADRNKIKRKYALIKINTSHQFMLFTFFAGLYFRIKFNYIDALAIEIAR